MDRAAAFGRVYAFLEALLKERSDSRSQRNEGLLGMILSGVDDASGRPRAWADKVHTALDGMVEETVTMYAPVVAVGRPVRSDVTVAGEQFRAGDRIALNFAAASRDPDVCENPGVFDATRKEIIHTAFGVGLHRCLGEHLARLEIRVTIEKMLREIPDFKLDPGTTPTCESSQLRTMTSLHLGW